jgi:protease-4
MKRGLSLVVLFALVAAPGCFNTSNINLMPFPDDELSAKVVKTVGDKDTDNRVLMLDIDGVITGEGESFMIWEHEATTTDVARKLRKAVQDDRIKAVVVRINSPGGTVTASDIVYKEILDYKKKSRQS